MGYLTSDFASSFSFLQLIERMTAKKIAAKIQSIKHLFYYIKHRDEINQTIEGNYLGVRIINLEKMMVDSICTFEMAKLLKKYSIETNSDLCYDTKGELSDSYWIERLNSDIENDGRILDVDNRKYGEYYPAINITNALLLAESTGVLNPGKHRVMLKDGSYAIDIEGEEKMIICENIVDALCYVYLRDHGCGSCLPK